MALSICYNIFDSTIPEIPLLPEAYIINKEGSNLGYIEKQATPQTLESFNIPYANTAHKTLIDLCSELKISALERRFKPSNKKKTLSLRLLLQDSKSKEIISRYITQKLATFYTTLYTHEYDITLQVNKKDPAENHRIHIKKQKLIPLLEFTKNDQGIEYAFYLRNLENIITPKDQNIQILLNDPSWVIINKGIYQIENLNANKLKPFFDKEKITIANKHLKTYLEKVIVPIIKNIDIVTHGFEVVTCSKIVSYHIEVIQDFLQNIYIAKVVFQYDNAHFEYHSTKTTSSNVDLEDPGEILITQTKRDKEAESKIIDLLTSRGLQVNNNLLLETSASQSNPYAVIEWLVSQKSQLEEIGFAIVLPKFDDRTVNLASYDIKLSTHKKSDWFDIKGVIIIGDQEIPFAKFISYIKRNDRFFPINDNEVFIIPQEWMTKYKKLADFGKTKDKAVQIPKSNYTILENIIPPEEISLDGTSEHLYEVPAKLNATLRPYQKEGLNWLIQHYYNQLGACLADDMGLGKTLQTIAMLVFAKEKIVPKNEQTQVVHLDLFSDPLEIKTYLKALIVLPSSLVFNWAQEILKFAPHLNIVKYTGSERKKLTPYLETYDIILTTYTTVAKDLNVLEKIEFQYLITDESQQIKNKESKIFKAVNRIPAKHKISLSGTPIENSLSDLWSQMEFINPGMLGTFPFFKEHFKIPIEKHQNQERIQELKTLIDPFILRRTKEQVAKDLPELSEQIIYTEMQSEQQKAYESQKSAARNALLGIDSDKINKINIINTLTKLRQLANHPKLIDQHSKNSSGKFEDVTHYLSTLVKSNKKILVFSSFVSHLAIYEDWCRQQNVSYVTLTGQTKASDREQVVNEFQQNDQIALFFISLKAGGVGLNLTKASYVVILDPWWNPFIEKQAIARSHRIGQSNKVMVSRFITKSSIEEKILQLQDKKKGLSDEIIDIDIIPEYIEEELSQLLN